MGAVRVCVRYRLLDPDGRVLERRHAEEPRCFILGQGHFFSHVERLLEQLEPGERRRIPLRAEQAFGERDEAKVVLMAREHFPPELPLRAGRIVAFNTPAGDEIAGQVVDCSEAAVAVDFNHPLAGKDMICDIELVSRDVS